MRVLAFHSGFCRFTIRKSRMLAIIYPLTCRGKSGPLHQYRIIAGFQQGNIMRNILVILSGKRVGVQLALLHHGLWWIMILICFGIAFKYLCFFILFIDIGNGKFLSCLGKSRSHQQHRRLSHIIYIVTSHSMNLSQEFQERSCSNMNIGINTAFPFLFWLFKVTLWNWNIRPWYPITNIRLPSEDRVPLFQWPHQEEFAWWFK